MNTRYTVVNLLCRLNTKLFTCSCGRLFEYSFPNHNTRAIVKVIKDRKKRSPSYKIMSHFYGAAIECRDLASLFLILIFFGELITDVVNSRYQENCRKGINIFSNLT